LRCLVVRCLNTAQPQTGGRVHATQPAHGWRFISASPAHHERFVSALSAARQRFRLRFVGASSAVGRRRLGRSFLAAGEDETVVGPEKEPEESPVRRIFGAQPGMRCLAALPPSGSLFCDCLSGSGSQDCHPLPHYRAPCPRYLDGFARPIYL